MSSKLEMKQKHVVRNVRREGHSKMGGKNKAASDNAAADQMERRNFNLKEKSDVVVSSVETTTESVPLSATLDALASNAGVDIVLKHKIISVVKGQEIALTIKNASAEIIALSRDKIINCLSRVELWSNAGQNLVCKMNRETLLYPMRFLTADALRKYRLGFQAEDDGELAIGETRTFYIPLITDIFALNEVYMSGIEGDITYRFFFDNSTWGANAVPALIKLAIITRHQQFDGAGRSMMKSRYSNMAQELRYRDMVEQNFTQTLEPSTKNELPLAQFNFDGSELYVQIFKANDLIENLVQYVESYDLLNQGDKSLLGSVIPVNYQNFVLNAHNSIENVLSPTVNDPWLIIPLSSDSTDDYARGAVNGYVSFSGKDKLVINTNSSLVSGSYKIRIYCAKLRKLTINAGVISVSS